MGKDQKRKGSHEFQKFEDKDVLLHHGGGDRSLRRAALWHTGTISGQHDRDEDDRGTDTGADHCGSSDHVQLHA